MCSREVEEAAYLSTEAILIDIAQVIQIGLSESKEARLSAYDAVYLVILVR